jgi:hypothetical protein
VRKKAPDVPGLLVAFRALPPTVIARSPLLTCPVQRDAGDSAERARLRSSPDCQAEDTLFAARSLQAQHLVLSAPLFVVVATT